MLSEVMMTREELVKYISELIESIKKKKDDALEIKFSDLIEVRKEIQDVSMSIVNLKKLNIEKVDDYIKIPMDVINIIMFYQLILNSKSYRLDDGQIRYIKYFFNELRKLIEKVFDEKIGNDKDIAVINRKLYSLNKVLELFLKKENITLEEYINIVKMIKQSNELSEYCDELLYNISSYIRYVMVGNDYLNLNYEKKR